MLVETSKGDEVHVPVIILESLSQFVLLHYQNTLLQSFKDAQYNHIVFRPEIVTLTSEDELSYDLVTNKDQEDSDLQYLFIDESSQELWKLLSDLDFPKYYQPLISRRVYQLFVDYSLEKGMLHIDYFLQDNLPNLNKDNTH